MITLKLKEKNIKLGGSAYNVWYDNNKTPFRIYIDILLKKGGRIFISYDNYTSPVAIILDNTLKTITDAKKRAIEWFSSDEYKKRWRMFHKDIIQQLEELNNKLRALTRLPYFIN